MAVVAQARSLSLLRAARSVGDAREALVTYAWSRATMWLALGLVSIVVELPRRVPSLFGLAPEGAPPNWTPPWLDDSGPALALWARWDSGWFVRIAEHGYASGAGSAAFFPLYPTAVAVLGRALGNHFVLAAVIVSFTSALTAFVLLERLVRDRLGEAAAARTVLYLAVFPMTIFLQAAYSESLFLALALAAFLLAERGRFGLAGAAAGFALLTRGIGLVLLPALALLAWRHESRARALASLLLAPALFLLYPLLLWIQTGHPLALFGAEGGPIWLRHISYAGPIGGVWDGLRAAWAGVEQLASGSTAHRYWSIVQQPGPFAVAAINLENLAFLVLYAGLAVVAWRRLPAAYALFATLSLLLPLATPSYRWPLLSMPRFGVVVFPFFMVLALLGARPRVHNAIVGVSSTLLGVTLVEWALWQWVA